MYVYIHMCMYMYMYARMQKLCFALQCNVCLHVHIHVRALYVSMHMYSYVKWHVSACTCANKHCTCPSASVRILCRGCFPMLCYLGKESCHMLRFALHWFSVVLVALPGSACEEGKGVTCYGLLCFGVCIALLFSLHCF